MVQPRTLVVVLAGGAGSRLESPDDDPGQAGRAVRRALPPRRRRPDQLPALGAVGRVAHAADQPGVAERPPQRRPALGPRPHARRLPRARAAAGQGHRQGRVRLGHRRRPVAAHRADPRVRARCAGRRELGRRLRPRLRAGRARPPRRATPTSRWSRRASSRTTRRGTASCSSRTAGSPTTRTSPTSPSSDLVTNEVFVFSPGPVLDLLDELGAGRRRGRAGRPRRRAAPPAGRGRPGP